MSDLFQPGVPDDYIEAVVRVMVEANWHTYQVLTKRSDRLEKLLSGPLRFAADSCHIWWGVSVEDRKYGLPRIADLQRTPAAMRFLSIEPLLEDLGEFDLSAIDWAIIGGESGHGARAMQPEWVENIYRICAKQRVLFFFKQWGGVKKSQTGRVLHGRTYDDMPRKIVAPIPSRKHRLEAARACESIASRWQTSDLIGLQAACA